MSFENPSPHIQPENVETSSDESDIEVSDDTEVDVDRRNFLKTMAMGGVGLTFTEQAEGTEILRESFSDWRVRMAESPRARIVEHPDVSLDGKLTYRLRGIAHVPETLVQHYDLIEHDIEQSGTVMLEYFDSRKLHNQNTEQMALGVAESEGDLRTAAEQNLYVHTVSDEFGSFFATVGGMAARHNKEIVVVNPQTDRSMRFSSMVGHNGLIGGGMGVTALVGFLGNEMLRKANQQPTRRDFLIRGALGATALAGASMTGMQQLRERAENEFSHERQELLDAVTEHLAQMEHVGLVEPDDALPIKLEKLQNCVLDWRDIGTALSILKMAEIDGEKAPDDPTRYTKDGEPLLHYEGAMHVGVLNYLANPELAKQRLSIYERTFNLDGDLSIRRFRYDADKESFDIVSEVPIIDKNNQTL